MGKCVSHPGIETSYMCMKENIYLCDECFECRNPNIYCKFRTACPIWFIEKEKMREERREAEEAAKTCKVVFKPVNKEVDVTKGKSLLDAAREANIKLNASCNGNGSCGKCKLVLESGNMEAGKNPLLSDNEISRNYILACQSIVSDDITVKLPEETIEKKLKVAGMGDEATSRLKGLVDEIRPVLQEIQVELNPPTLDDSASDLDRLNRGLKKSGFDITKLTIGISTIRELSNIMREENFKVTAIVVQKKCSNEVLHVLPGWEETKSYGLAVDIGTTSIVVYLVDMSDGSIAAATSGHNRQASCGDDVINRIVCSEREGVKKLSMLALATINGLINEALDSIGAEEKNIKNIILSGNTTMMHLLLQIEPRFIRREPYIPTISEFPILKAGDIGLNADPFAAVFVMPGPASYVGGDIVSGVLYSRMHLEEPMTLFIDVGTNGEIVLGNKDWLMSASCSAGPAFEGGGVKWGMRAEEGAIEKVSIDPKTLEPDISTVGNVPARGICGSGMIDLLSEMLVNRIIDRSGKYILDTGHPRMKIDRDESAFVIAFAEDTSIDDDIILLESDIDNILRSKGAVYAGFIVLLKQVGLDFSSVDRFIITGGFGQYLNIDKAVIIGLLPDIDRNKFKYLGNSSIAGAYMALLSDGYRDETLQISKKMTYIDFSSNNQFMNEFTSALFLPHTNINDFPSVKSRIEI